MSMTAKAGDRMVAWRDSIPWARVKKGVSVLFFALIGYLLVTKALELDWQKIWTTFKGTDPLTLLTATGLGMVCYLAYASYDLIGRSLFNVAVPKYKTLLAAWISYACNVNFGALIGSVAFRYRLYARLGVNASTVTKIMSVSVFSNWLGYLMLAGVLFVSGAFTPPDSWFVSAQGFRWLGLVFCLLVVAYVGACAFMPNAQVHVRGRTLTLPALPMVAWQLATATVHWTLMACVIYQFFAGDVAFGKVYIALLVSCVAGAISHVPGGLGVVEAVFTALLLGELPRHEIIAAVFAYRCVFYFVPLLLTLPTYVVFETALAERKAHE